MLLVLAPVLSLALTPSPPQCEEARLVSDHPGEARSADLSEGRALVGFPSGPGAAQVHAFELRGGAWLGPQVLQGPQSSGSGFGSALALHGSLAAVGDPLAATLGPDAGAVHLLAASGGGWVPLAQLLPPPAASGGRFGSALAADEAAARVVSGAPRFGGQAQGAVFVHEDRGSGWVHVATLLAEQPAAIEGFGHALALDGDRLAVGSPASGRVRLFERSPSGGWAQLACLEDPAGPAGGFGTSVALQGEWLAAGAPLAGRGEVHTFQLAGSTWSPAGVLEPEVGVSGSAFGSSLDLSGSALAVGVPGASSWGEPASGRVDLYRHDGQSWQRARSLRASDGMAGDRLGTAVALEGEAALSLRAGASAPRGAGALHWHGALDCPGPDVGVQYCSSTVLNSVGFHGRLRGLGSARVASRQLVLQARDLPPGVPAMALVSRDAGLVVQPPGSEGTLCLGGTIARLAGAARPSDPAGRVRFPVHLPGIPTTPPTAILPGEVWRFQVWYRDWNPDPTSNLTEGLEVAFR